MATEHSQDPGGLYAGEVTDQLLAHGKSGEVQLILTVKVTAAVKDEKAPSESAIPCPPQEAEVWLNFSETAEDRLRMSLRDLERLGFTGDDLSKLHPDHPECYLLVGVKVHVRPKVSGALTYWNFAWPRERPKPVAIGEIKGATDTLAARIRAIRTKKAKNATTAAEQVGNTSDEE